jgi:hypothetical protein
MSMVGNGLMLQKVFEPVMAKLESPNMTPTQEDYSEVRGIILANKIADEELLTGSWEIHASVAVRIPVAINCEITWAGILLGGTGTPVMENTEASELSGMVTSNTAA